MVNQGAGAQPIATPESQSFPISPKPPAQILGDKVRQLPPRTMFEAPEANPSKPISTDTQVSNASPGYMTIGMGAPTPPSFSYLRR